MSKAPSIKELIAMDDAELSDMLGYKAKVASFRETLKELDALPKDQRKKAEQRVKEKFNPDIYPDSFKWILDDVKREEKCLEINTCCAGSCSPS